MDGGLAPFARPRRVRRALLLAGVVVLFAAAVGAGVALDRPGKGGGSGDGAVAEPASTLAAGGDGNGSGAAGSGAGGQSPSGGGGGTGGGGSSSPTTTSATSTTTGATTTTEVPLAFAEPPSAGASASCTPSKFGGYDFTVRFMVSALFNHGGRFSFQWGRGRGDVRVDPVGTETTDGRRIFQFQDQIFGNCPSRTDTVVDHLHFLDPPSLATTLTITHSICPSH